MKCPNGDTMVRVHHAEKNKTVCVGFYCSRCRLFVKSIGRERQLPIKNGRVWIYE